MAISWDSTSSLKIGSRSHSEGILLKRQVSTVLQPGHTGGGYGTVAGVPDALKLWDTIGENHKRVVKK